jgi:hypothetical protein
MRKLLVIPALLLAATVSAQDVRTATYNFNYDLDSTSYTYCVAVGVDGSPWSAPIPGVGRAETSASSTTVTGVTGAANSFGPVSTGDIIYFQTAGGAAIIRYVASNADDDTITVNAAVNLDVDGGYAFSFLKVTCGTAATDGWIDVSGYAGKKISLEITQMVATGGVDFKFECRDNTTVSTAHQVYPGESSDCGTNGTLTSGVCNVATGTTGTWDLIFSPEEQWDACRVGVKIGSADDGGDLTTNAEIINTYVKVWNPR